MEIAKFIASLDVFIDIEGYIYYHDIVYSILRKQFGLFRFKKRADKLRAMIIVREENKTLKRL